MADPMSDAELVRLRDLHARGLGCREIARELNRGQATISRAATRLGLAFDRAATVTATAAVVADAKARRARLELNYLDDAERLRAQLWAQHTYIDHGGKDFVRVKWTQPEPTAADKLRLMQASKLAADTSLKLAQHDADSGADDAKSMLGALAAGLRVAYDQLDAQPEPDPS